MTPNERLARLERQLERMRTAPSGTGGTPGGDPGVHVLATNLGLGPFHSMSGATDGDVLRATGAATARFEPLSHDDLTGITTDQHHAKLHDITDNNNHTIQANPWGVVGAINTNTLGILNATSDATAPTEALLKSDGNGDLYLRRLIADDRVYTPRVEASVGDLSVVANSDVVVTPGRWTLFADNKDMRSQSHTSGFLGQGWRISWPETDKPHLDIRSIYAEQLEVTAFQADIMRVRIAEDFLTQGMAFTAAPFTTPNSIGGSVRVTFESNPVLGAAELFLADEWVLFNIIQRDAGLTVAQIWGQVSSYQVEADDNGVACQSWLFTLRSGLTDFVVPKSQIALAWGTSSAKNGYIHHNVLSTAHGPWTRYATWSGANPYTVANRKYHVQVGNLYGLVDIDSDRYGIAAGDNLAKTPDDATNPFKGFTADNTGGMRLFNTDISAYVAGVQKLYIAASGSEMWLGTSSSDKRFSYLDGDLTVIGVLEAAGHQFRADEDGVKILVSPGAMFEGLSESVQWLYNSLDTGLRTWIGTRVYGSGDNDSQLSLVAMGGVAGAWGSVALRAREGDQDPLLDTEGATFIVTPSNIWMGPQAGLRVSSDPANLATPVPGGQLYAETIYVDDLVVLGSFSGESLSGASWAYPGDILIDAQSGSDTTVTIINNGAGHADLVVDRDIIIGGAVDGVDVSSFYTAYSGHIANANAHHNQVHALDGGDHTGTLAWASVSKSGSSLADLATRSYADLQNRSHDITGADHSAAGLTAGHVLRASAATTFAFAQLQHADLGGVTADQHHAQVHSIIGIDHTIAAAQYQVVGATGTNVLGLLTPASSPGTNTLVMTDANSRLTLLNLTTTNAILANGGVDFGGDTLSEDLTYLQLAGSKPLYTAVALQADNWSLTTDGMLTVPNITSPGELLLVPQSSVVFGPGDNSVYMAEGVWIASADYSSETTGWGISPTGAGDFRSIFTNELIAKSFIVDLEQALAGGEIVTKSVTKLAYSFSVPHATTTPIVFRAKATASTTTSVLTIPKPTGTLQDDLMTAHIVLPSTHTIVSWPENWFLIISVNSGSTRLYAFFKTAGASEPASFAFGLSGNAEALGTIQSFSGTDPGDPVYAYTSQNGSGQNIIIPGITTDINGVGMVLMAGVYDTTNAGTSGSPTNGYVEREDALGPAHTWIGATTIVQSGLGLANNPLLALSVSRPWAGVLYGLKPATYNTTRIYVEDLPSATGMAVFESGDIVRLRMFSRAGGGLTIADCWGMVGNYANVGNKIQSWTFARSAAPNAGSMGVGTVVEAGSLVLDYGTDGDGFYEINAYSGTYASTAPYAQVVKWTGHPATGQVVRTREGNLEGVTLQANEYGFWAGAKGANPLGTADQYIRVSNLGVLINNVPLKLYNGGGVQTIQLNSDGTAWFKDGAGVTKLDWDGFNLSIVGSITVTGGNAATSADLAGRVPVGGAAADVNANVTTIDGGKITTNSITANQIQANTITAGQIAANTITATQIAANTITAAKIAAGTITTTQLSFTPVQSTNVVAFINASAEGIRIAGNRITIDGTVSFSSGYNPTTKVASGGAAADVNAGVTTISGGKITTGSITATQIATGTITANQIAAGTITGDRLSLTSYLAINSATWSTLGIQLQYNNGSPRAYIGNGGASYLQYENGSVFISGSIVASGGGISGDFYVGSNVGANGYLYVGSNADIRMGTDGIKLVMADLGATPNLPTRSAALRWYPNIADTFDNSKDYSGILGYRHTGQLVVDNIWTSFVGTTHTTGLTKYSARIILQAGNHDGATYRDTRLEVIKDPGANAYGSIRCIATYTKVEGMLTLKEQAPPPTPVHEGCVYFTPSGKMVFAHYDGSSTFFKWLDMTQTSVTWQHSTSAPA